MPGQRVDTKEAWEAWVMEEADREVILKETCRSIRRRNKAERWNRDILLGILPKSLELARRTCGSRSQPRSTSQIHPNVEPKGGGWTDNDEIQERGKRQTHPHHEEDGVRVRSDIRVARSVSDQPHTKECRARITTRRENDPAHAKRLEENPTKRVKFANPELKVPPPSES